MLAPDPFDYVGCYDKANSLPSQNTNSPVDTSKFTVKQCAAACRKASSSACRTNYMAFGRAPT